MKTKLWNFFTTFILLPVCIVNWAPHILRLITTVSLHHMRCGAHTRMHTHTHIISQSVMWLHLPKIPPLSFSLSSKCLLRSLAFCSIRRVSSYLLCVSASEIMSTHTLSALDHRGFMSNGLREILWIRSRHHITPAARGISFIPDALWIIWQCVILFREPKLSCH